MSAPKPTLTRLSDLAPGQRGDFFALLTDRNRGETREGKPYYACRFRDARRAVSLMVWGDDRWFAECEKDWHPGQFFKLRAVYVEHERYGLQIELQQLRPVTEADRAGGFDEADFVESSRHDIPGLLTSLRGLAAEHIDGPLLHLVEVALDRHGPALARLPAVRERSYPFVGGLLEHTLSVARVAVDLAVRYRDANPDLKPPVNVALVAAAAVLHDLGRVAEMDGEVAAPALTVPGRLLGPAVLGRDLVREAAREVPDLDPALLTQLEHILLTHLNPAEGAGPRTAATPEALIVHHADALDLQMELMTRRLTRDPGEGPFTDRDPALGRPLLKARL